MEALIGPATAAAQIVVFVCVLVIGLAALIAIAVGAFIVIHWLWDRAFGECGDCQKERTKREEQEIRRQAEVERIIRQHDRETPRTRRTPDDMHHAEIEAQAIRRLGARGAISSEDADRIAREHVERRRRDTDA